MRGGRGQASVEMVAAVPLVVLAAAVVVQVALAAQAWGAAREAARAGARAEQVHAPAGAAARRVLGHGLARRSDVRVVTDRDGARRVVVRVPVPMLLPWIPGPGVSADQPVPG